MPTFKLGLRGIALVSQAVTVKNDTEKKSLQKFFIKGEDNALNQVGYLLKPTDENIKDKVEIYDTVISTANISSISFSNGFLNISLNNGQNFKISTTFDSIKTPDETEIGEIAVYGSTDGKLFGNSGSQIKNSININPENQNDISSVPTIGAVKDFVTGVSLILDNRIAGNNVNLPEIDEEE